MPICGKVSRKQTKFNLFILLSNLVLLLDQSTNNRIMQVESFIYLNFFCKKYVVLTESMEW